MVCWFRLRIVIWFLMISLCNESSKRDLIRWLSDGWRTVHGQTNTHHKKDPDQQQSIPKTYPLSYEWYLIFGYDIYIVYVDRKVPSLDLGIPIERYVHTNHLICISLAYSNITINIWIITQTWRSNTYSCTFTLDHFIILIHHFPTSSSPSITLYSAICIQDSRIHSNNNLIGRRLPD